MLSKGTKTLSRQDIQDKLSALKSSINFRGANGRTYVSINSTEENLEETLKLMSDMLLYCSSTSFKFLCLISLIS